MNTILAILAIGVLIVVHEAGHYIVARLCSMRVERFSIGFGPAILSRRSKKTGTQFQIAPILFGGFVEIKGMNILEEVDPNDASSYPNRPVWQRFLTIFAGPATNYLLAVVLAFTLFAGYGLQGSLRTCEVTEIAESSAAAGVLQKGDVLVAVEGKPIDVDLIVLVNQIGDRDAEFQIERAGQPMTLVLHPRYDEAARSYRLGVGLAVTMTGERVDIGIGSAAKEAIVYPVVQTKAILVGLYEFITGKVEGRVSSVVGITQVTKQAIDDGLISTLTLLMILNVYLGLFNLFPLPALDGGRLVFLAYEMVTRRRANPKLEASIHMVGVLVLAVLVVVVTVNDCRHL